MRIVAQSLLAALILTIGPPGAMAHPGGLNSEGCHTNKKTGEYHCHRSPAPEKAKGIVKMSRSGICHGPDSPYYAQTQNYTSYPTLKACLESGGRLPR